MGEIPDRKLPILLRYLDTLQRYDYESNFANYYVVHCVAAWRIGAV